MAFGVRETIKNKIEAPIRTATVIACAGLIVAILALVIATSNRAGVK